MKENGLEKSCGKIFYKYNMEKKKVKSLTSPTPQFPFLHSYICALFMFVSFAFPQDDVIKGITPKPEEIVGTWTCERMPSDMPPGLSGAERCELRIRKRLLEDPNIETYGPWEVVFFLSNQQKNWILDYPIPGRVMHGKILSGPPNDCFIFNPILDGKELILDLCGEFQFHFHRSRLTTRSEENVLNDYVK